jgi:hypothetical protein
MVKVKIKVMIKVKVMVKVMVKVKVMIKVKVKGANVKLTLVQVMNAKRRSRGKLYSFFNLDAKWGGW